MNLFKIVLLLFIAVAIPAEAATLSFKTEENGSVVSAYVLLDTEGEKVNAVEGVIRYDDDVLELDSISDGNSRINLWIERPKESERGVVSFSGVTPSGFSGGKEKIVTLTFKKKTEGQGGLSFENIQVLLHDGLGTPAVLKTHAAEIVFSRSPVPDTKSGNDTESPEDFKPEIITDRDVFGGKYVLIFATQDKLSGVEKYQVREGFFARYVNAESPYLLHYQKLERDIFVKAVDYAGNERIVVLSAQNPRMWYEHYELFAILLGIAFVFFILTRVRAWIASRRTL